MEETLEEKEKKLLPFIHAVKALKPGHLIDYDHMKKCLTQERVKLEWDWEHLPYSEIIAKTKSE